MEETIQKLLFTNRRTPNNNLYTVPSSFTYPYQWLWDSCFHAIILSHFNTSDAKKEIVSLVSKQFDNGMIPHMIYWEKATNTDFPVIKWGKENTSTITQPPMLAYAVWKIYEKDHDLSFIKHVYPKLYHFYKYLLSERDPHENYLIGIMNPDESGEDNSPRFDIPLHLSPVHTLEENVKRRTQLVKQNIACKFDAPFCMRNFFWVKDVPFNAIMVENLWLLATLAKHLDRFEDAAFFEEKKERIKKAMRKLMLEENIFWSTFGKDYQKIKVKTWAMFAPLFAKMLTHNEAKQLVEEHLLNSNEFWTTFPVPTVSIDEPSFNPKGFWRGSVWASTNWFIYKGLINYGFVDIAKDVKKSTIDLLEKSGFREYFNPTTGEGYGAKDFTWGCLVIDMN